VFDQHLSDATAGPRGLTTGTGLNDPVKDDVDEGLSGIDNYWEERRLDGSRDYWQIRENGHFWLISVL